MKKLLMMVVVLVTAAALFTSCGGSGDPDAGGGSGGGGGGYSGGGGGYSGGGGTIVPVSITYIFDKSTLTQDCSEKDFDAFFETSGNYECQYVYRNADSPLMEEAVLTYDQRAEYTITKESSSTPPDTEFTKATSTIYVQASGISDSDVKEEIKEFWEDEGYSVSFSGDTAICSIADYLEDVDDIPLYPGQYMFKDICKTNADKSKVYLKVALDTEYSYELLIAKK
ncbi:MAG: hypothetical protein J6X78_05080 [Treponema sp.]|nr:hypothetical protein [Treponema sp.]